MNTSPKLYSYIRFSTAEQSKGHSLERQMTYAKEYAKKHDMVLDESLTMRDEGLSAYHQSHIKRGAFGLFLSAIEAGRVSPGSILVVEGLDRISRAEPIEAQAILSQIIMAGITVVTASDNKVYDRETIRKNPMELVYSLLIFVRANEESETKSVRVRKSILARIKQWKDTGKGDPIRVGHDPVWVHYDSSGQCFRLVDHKAAIVHKIISLYKQGWSFIKITKDLSETTPPLYDGVWNLQVIYRMISDDRLIGRKTINVDGETYKIQNYYPSILTIQEFDEIQQIRKKRGSTKSQGKIPSLITGMRICFCGYCGFSLNSQNHVHKIKSNIDVPDGYRRVVCSAKLNNVHGCLGASSISIVPIERALLEYCADQMELSSILGDNDQTVDLRLQIVDQHRILDETEQKLKAGEQSILDLLSQGHTVSPVINNLVEDLRADKECQQQRIQDLEEQLHYHSRHKATDLAEEWQKLKLDVYDLNEETRLMVRQLVKRTFKRLDIFLHGVQDSAFPDAIKSCFPTGEHHIDMMLTFPNDRTRLLSIDKKTGSWIKGGDLEWHQITEAMQQVLAERQTSGIEEPA